MPKELTHWIIAERTRARLSGGQASASIDAFPHHFALGAII